MSRKGTLVVLCPRVVDGTCSMLVWQSLCRRLVDTWYEVSRIDLSMLIMGAVLGSMLFDFLFLFLILQPP